MATASAEVMLLHMLLTWHAELHGNKLESLLLETGDDWADESSLDTVWLDHDVSSLSNFSCFHLYCFLNYKRDQFKWFKY